MSDDDKGITIGTLKSLIQEVVGSSKSTEEDAHRAAEHHTASRLDRSSSVAAAVQAELAKLQAKDKEDKEVQERQQQLDNKLAELSEKTKEKPPVERRRVHKLMGWGEPE